VAADASLQVVEDNEIRWITREPKIRHAVSRAGSKCAGGLAASRGKARQK
jgi:hypothetical protein